jgi:hypothetical protein
VGESRRCRRRFAAVVCDAVEMWVGALILLVRGGKADESGEGGVATDDGPVMLAARVERNWLIVVRQLDVPPGEVAADGRAAGERAAGDGTTGSEGGVMSLLELTLTPRLTDGMAGIDGRDTEGRLKPPNADVAEVKKRLRLVESDSFESLLAVLEVRACLSSLARVGLASLSAATSLSLGGAGGGVLL